MAVGLLVTSRWIVDENICVKILTVAEKSRVALYHTGNVRIYNSAIHDLLQNIHVVYMLIDFIFIFYLIYNAGSAVQNWCLNQMPANLVKSKL